MWKIIILLILLYSPIPALSQSFETFLNRAKLGDAACMSYVGTCLINGTGVTKDEQEGFKWCYQAAQKGDLNGMAMTGWCYTNGIGVSKNQNQGFEYSLKAAQKGQMGAQYL